MASLLRDGTVIGQPRFTLLWIGGANIKMQDDTILYLSIKSEGHVVRRTSEGWRRCVERKNRSGPVQHGFTTSNP